MVFRAGELVISTAGHDIGKIYLVLKDEGQKILVSDGKIKKLSNPKLKNKKHVRLVHKNIEEISKKIESNQAIDADIVYAIRILKGECNV